MSLPERLAVIGDPIDHSLSPAMQGAALAAADLPWTYEAVRVRAAELSSWVDRVRAGEFAGFNITIPHKVAIAGYLDERALSALRAGAVNTVVRSGRRLIGHNTDLSGFSALLAAHMSPSPGDLAVVMGAGGAARAVVCVLRNLCVRCIIVNRTFEKARTLADDFGAVALEPSDPDVLRFLEQANVIVNATSLGMGAQVAASPLPPHIRLWPNTVAVDLVYGHDTPFLRQARAAGCRTADGAEMLVQQGAESFRLWTGLEPNLDIMRGALLARLGEVEHAEISHRG